ncbi:MAG: S1 RNA-binding domain-containing protein [Clostridia bacterium]|nr:S1 RNA-binding domain-containing protein [Clostridia bacterium]
MELTVGSVFDGKVTGITKFGAFVALPENKTGMVHISEVAHTYVADISEHLSEGQEVRVKVIGIDPNGRVNLSIKQTMTPPAKREVKREAPRKPAPVKEAAPLTFEDRLRQFMQDSESRMSDISRNTEKRRGGNRRGRK